jgi:hypothetical protein
MTLLRSRPPPSMNLAGKIFVARKSFNRDTLR